MDEDTRTAGPQVGAAASGAREAGAEPERSPEPAPARSPEEIRADIEETRGQVGDTVEALAEKTDVKGQAQQRITDLKANLQHKGDDLTAKAKSTTPQSAQQGGQQLVAKVRENPAPVAVGGAVLAGFLLGRLTGRRG